MPQDTGKNREINNKGENINTSKYRPYSRIANNSEQEVIKHGHNTLSIELQNILNKSKNKEIYEYQYKQEIDSLDTKDKITNISEIDFRGKIKSRVIKLVLEHSTYFKQSLETTNKTEEYKQKIQLYQQYGENQAQWSSFVAKFGKNGLFNIAKLKFEAISFNAAAIEHHSSAYSEIEKEAFNTDYENAIQSYAEQLYYDKYPEGNFTAPDNYKVFCEKSRKQSNTLKDWMKQAISQGPETLKSSIQEILYSTSLKLVSFNLGMTKSLPKDDSLKYYTKHASDEMSKIAALSGIKTSNTNIDKMISLTPPHKSKMTEDFHIDQSKASSSSDINLIFGAPSTVKDEQDFDI